MDTPNLVVPLVAVLLLILAPRAILQSVGTASDVVAQLFVPPDRALGWPHGVQEGDEPWGWRGELHRDGSDPAAQSDLDGDGPMLVELVDLPPDRAVRGALVVAVRRVRS